MKQIAVDAETLVSIRRSSTQLGSQVRVVSRRRGKTGSVYLPRELLESGFRGYPYKRSRSATLFSVRRSSTVVLSLSSFEELRRRCSTWLASLRDEIRGDKLLARSYLSGTLSTQVFCLSTGRHWTLQKYLEVLLLPLTMWNYMWIVEDPDEDVVDAVYTLEESQISSMQEKFAHFDFTVSPSWIMHLIHHTNAPFIDQFGDLIDSLGASEILDMLHLNNLVYDAADQSTSQTGLKHVTHECKRLCPVSRLTKWDYIDPCSGVCFQADPSLAFALLEGRVQQLNRRFSGFDWSFPEYVLKSYFSPDYLVKHSSVVEIGVFDCRWCQIVVRHRKRVLAISPLMNLTDVLRHLSGKVIRVDPSFLACDCPCCARLVREITDHHSTLQCLAARAYQHHFTNANHQSLSLVPPLIRERFLAGCSDADRTSS